MHWTYAELMNLPRHIYVELVEWVHEAREARAGTE